MMMMTIRFEDKVLKRHKSKNFKVKNSYGNKQAWRWIKKNKWLNIGLPVSEGLFGYIIKRINEYLVSKLLNGSDIVFPYKMGRLELRKFRPRIQLEKDKIVTNLPVDWKRTLLWWKEDNKAFAAKSLLRYENKMMFRVYYNKKYAIFKNRQYYQFTANRRVKQKLKDKINNNEIDTFLEDYEGLH